MTSLTDVLLDAASSAIQQPRCFTTTGDGSERIKLESAVEIEDGKSVG